MAAGVGAHAVILEDIFDSTQAFRGWVEEGQQMGDDPMIEMPVGIAVARLPAQRLELVFEHADQPPSGERFVAGPAPSGRGGSFGGGCHAA